MDTSSRSSISSRRLVLLLALYFFFVLNLPLTTRLAGILEGLDGVSAGFVLSIPVFFVAALNLLFTLVAVKYLEKGIFITLLLLSSAVSYAMFEYGVVFDRDMMANIMQTHRGEASSYLNVASVLWFGLTGLLPALLVARVRIEHGGVLKDLRWKGVSVLGSLAAIGLVAAGYYQDYASVGRNHNYLKQLIIPTYYLSSAGGYIDQTYLTETLPWRPLGEDASVARPHRNGKPNLLVLMVGETARGMNFELNGYPRDTNAFTREQGVVSFQSVSSCGTATAVSVPCMFSRQSHDDYDAGQAGRQDNLLDVLSHAGLDITWLDNDGGCKGVCERVATRTFRPEDGGPLCDGDYCQDGVLLEPLHQALERPGSQDRVLVLHMVGSHGPTYYQRYPAEFAHFTPDCRRSDIQNCSARELVNTYDNTLYYSDYIISRVLTALKQHSNEWNTGLLYLSDHGESLGESGLYLHGMPYALAPEQQTRVPLLLWLSGEFEREIGLNRRCLQQQAREGRFSHDNLFDSVLGLMGVSTRVYRAELDMLAPCRLG
ncbi:phosphoethanolamine--lipid A transferase [Oceanimonas pelagia]|uniref:Phosphoethanolamine--lipid A transferase n=1 Tax=Oceanimonas pelagia TaxID=3028314 RepID=A0AA50KRE7_9GAMM|nr:phosphoethanolamine--lipid A transferase [Oceanimonas pelagia]WMC11582.1 phosphoethanolamine--lipid A transferase [Oceanimonas pelagia]